VSALRLSGVRKSFGALTVLRDLDLTVEEGALATVLGPSGCGKTTLLRVVAGFDPADGGQVEIGDQIVDDGRRHLPAERRRIGYVAQEGSLFPHLSVAANVGFGLSRGRERAGRVGELLDLVGLGELAERRPHELSGGEQQRVALARALAPRPRLVLLDEPFSALDAGLRADLRSEVRRALSAEGATALLVTHDQDEALSMSDLVAVMRDGRVVQAAPPADVYMAPADPDVARFVGEVNLLTATRRGGIAESSLGALHLDPASAALAPAHGDVVVFVRPEQISLREVNGHGVTPVGSVTRRVFFGHDAVLHVALDAPADREVVVRTLGQEAPPVGSRVRVAIRGAVRAWASGAG
jgi:iron(III) transport system ATP-binding protein